MSREEMLKELEEMLEMDEGSLEETTLLQDLEEWDSVARLSLIVLFEEELNKELTGDEIKEFHTVADILNKM